jgi:hypothetical protein
VLLQTLKGSALGVFDLIVEQVPCRQVPEVGVWASSPYGIVKRRPWASPPLIVGGLLRFIFGHGSHGSVVEHLNLGFRIPKEVLGLRTRFLGADVAAVSHDVFNVTLACSRATPWRDIVRGVRLSS